MSENTTTTWNGPRFTKRALSIDEMQRLFDETAERNEERRHAIAECMSLIGEKGYQLACAESAKRIEEKERQASRRYS